MTNEMTKDNLLKKRKKLQSFRTPNFNFSKITVVNTATTSSIETFPFISRDFRLLPIPLTFSYTSPTLASIRPCWIIKIITSHTRNSALHESLLNLAFLGQTAWNIWLCKHAGSPNHALHISSRILLDFEYLLILNLCKITNSTLL